MIPRQPQLSRNAFHRLDAERDVLFQVDAQIRSAVEDVIAITAAGRVVNLPSVQPIERATREPRMDPQSTVFPAQLYRP